MAKPARCRRSAASRRSALQLGLQQRGAQLLQGAAAEEGAQQQAVGLQRMIDLQQRAGKVVDPVKDQAGEHKVEAAGGKGLIVLVQDQPRTVGLIGAREGRGREVGLDQVLDAAAAGQRARQASATASQLEGQGKPAAHVGKPIGQPLGDLAVEKIDVRESGRGARAPPAQQRTVEKRRRMVHEARLWRARRDDERYESTGPSAMAKGR
jgi:hypothetical protein